MFGKIKKTYQKGKEVEEQIRAANLKKLDTNADKIKQMTEGLDKTDLKILKSKVGDIFGSTPGKIKKLIKMITGGTLLGGFFEGGRQVGKEQMKAKGGYVKMNRGGEAKRKSSSSKKSRGTGAAIKGTKFKGVF